MPTGNYPFISLSKSDSIESGDIVFAIGPAGTGKTESVKALGNQLGRFVLVFNCDETFDFQVGIMFTFISYSITFYFICHLIIVIILFYV